MRTRMIAALAAVVALGLAGGGLAPAVSAAPAPARKAKPYVVTLNALPAKAQAGQALTLAGRVSGPDNARKPVLLQRRQSSGGWVTAATVRTTRRGTFSAKVRLTTGGPTSFRAVKARSKKRSQGTSAARSLAVYQWLDLASQPTVVLGIMAMGNDVTMGGRTYAGSLASQFSGSLVMVRTAGLCTAMEAYSGFLDKDLPKLGTGGYQVLELVAGDEEGEQVTPFQTPPGSVVRRAIDITGSQRSSVRFHVEAGDGATGPLTAVVGSPRVLCNAARLPSFPDDLVFGGP